MPIIVATTESAGPTLEDLVNELIIAVQGDSVAADQVRALGADCSATDTDLAISGVGPGVVEIDDELIRLVSTGGPGSGQAVVHPRGRGWRGTTPAAHEAGAVVTVNPTLSRQAARQAITAVTRGLYPQVFGVFRQVSVKASDLVQIPSDAESILDVQTLEPDGSWTRVRAWEPVFNAENLTSRAVRTPTVADGTTIQVTVGVRPEPLSALDQRWSDTGLPQPLADAVILGALARLARLYDFGRFGDRASRAEGDNQQPQLGAGFAMARQIQADYQAAVDREAQVLRSQFPARVHFTR